MRVSSISLFFISKIISLRYKYVLEKESMSNFVFTFFPLYIFLFVKIDKRYFFRVESEKVEILTLLVNVFISVLDTQQNVKSNFFLLAVISKCKI